MIVTRNIQSMSKLIVTTIFICNIGNIMGLDPLDFKYGQLVFSTLIYRHGDRAVQNTYSYSNDPYANKSYWPMGFGQITPIGIERHFELGKWLRKRYSGWLAEVYSTDDVYVKSSDFDRTINSAQANLAGMYPPVEPTHRNETLGKRIQLVPIHTVPKFQDNKLASTADCPLYLQEYDKLYNDQEIQKFYRQFSSVFEYIENNTDLKMGKKFIASTKLLYDTLLVQSQFNYKLPKWTKQIYPEPLLTIVKQCFELQTHTNIMKRLKAGPLLNEIVTHMYSKKNGTLNPNRMLWIYSAHDTTIVALLNSMKLYEYTLVPYAAVLMIELRLNITGNYVVTVSYRNTSSHEPYLLHVPGCDSVACELDQFIELLRPILTVDWDTECKANVENNFLELWIYFVGIILVVVVLMLISSTIVDKVLCCFRKRSNYQS